MSSRAVSLSDGDAKKQPKKTKKPGKGIVPLAVTVGICHALKVNISPAGVLVGLLFARSRYKSSDARREALQREAALAQARIVHPTDMK